jgi:hypothetical protein
MRGDYLTPGAFQPRNFLRSIASPSRGAIFWSEGEIEHCLAWTYGLGKRWQGYAMTVDRPYSSGIRASGLVSGIQLRRELHHKWVL